MFNALCENGKAQAANFPFCTIEPNVGIVAVPDPRLEVLRWVRGSTSAGRAEYSVRTNGSMAIAAMLCVLGHCRAPVTQGSVLSVAAAKLTCVLAGLATKAAGLMCCLPGSRLH